MKIGKKDDSEIVQSLISEALHVDVEVENVFQLGHFNREDQRTRLVRFSVHDMDGKRKVPNASKNLKNVEGYSNIYFTPDLTRSQREIAFKLREERRRRIGAGEKNLVIRRGKIIEQAPRQQTGDDAYVAPEEEVHSRPAGAAFSRVVNNKNRTPPGTGISRSSESFR